MSVPVDTIKSRQQTLQEKLSTVTLGRSVVLLAPWTRVAYLNMSDSSSVCPPGTQKFVNGSAIVCGIQDSSIGTCVSITASVTSNYSQICGQVAGYQKGSTDGFSTNGIDSTSLDGVSITRGSPRQHVWSYVIALQGNDYAHSSHPGLKICPCSKTSRMQVPSFVGSDYYCESGCPGIFDQSSFYWNDVMWDGGQCGILETDCCTTPGEPWFHKVLDVPSIDDVEIRICIDQQTGDENTLVSAVRDRRAVDIRTMLPLRDCCIGPFKITTLCSLKFVLTSTMH